MRTSASGWMNRYVSFTSVSLARLMMAAAPSAVEMSIHPALVSIPMVNDKPVKAKHSLPGMIAAKFGKSFNDIPDIPETAITKELSHFRAE
ncbi:holo-[acyl-carrier-protein] synthase [Phytophthora cinnamomi]|uniref:holo-[acyl-carrier-protein] synthase n=1 Tax=Phytophthora cinnamomi TaxID=4785 RepID=UPI0035596899|nr:holo-[acyl-carrier-protein] synthase [Phytophthora cinnamomi]